MARPENGKKTRVAHRVVAYLGATVFQGVLGLALLPLATTMLGPSDYGVYALAMTIVIAAAAVADLGQNILLSAHYEIVTLDQRRSLLGSVLFSCVAMAVLLSIPIALLWDPLMVAFGAQEGRSKAVMAFTIGAVWLRAVVGTANQFFLVSHRTFAAAFTVTTQAGATFVATLAALFMADLHMLSLFVGNAAGLAVAAVVALFILRRDVFALPSKTWVVRLLRSAPHGVAAATVDAVRSTIEGFIVTKASGVGQFGLYVHSRLYHSLMMQFTNAVSYSVWPIALSEARSDGKFAAVGRAWNVIYLWITLGGLALAFFADEVVSLLTNGRFVEAAQWVPFWAAYLLLQNSGKPATAVLFAKARGAWVSMLRFGVTLVALAAMLLVVPAFGVPGLLAVLFVEALIFRIGMAVVARRVQALPFQDRWVVGGSFAIVAAMLLNGYFGASITARVSLLVLMSLVVVIVGRREMADTAHQVLSVLRPWALGPDAPKPAG
jgi:O-antigen/teichoic acid export membrane protein